MENLILIIKGTILDIPIILPPLILPMLMLVLLFHTRMSSISSMKQINKIRLKQSRPTFPLYNYFRSCNERTRRLHVCYSYKINNFFRLCFSSSWSIRDKWSSKDKLSFKGRRKCRPRGSKSKFNKYNSFLKYFCLRPLMNITNVWLNNMTKTNKGNERIMLIPMLLLHHHLLLQVLHPLYHLLLLEHHLQDLLFFQIQIWIYLISVPVPVTLTMKIIIHRHHHVISYLVAGSFHPCAGG